MKINCLIVDDEPIARDIVKNYCGYLEDLNVVGLCGNALEAKTILQSHAVDILFLDINMPVIDGVSFAKTLKDRPQLIFTTAYKEFAADAFDLAACDYLLKPFSFDRFIIAIDRAVDKLRANSSQKGFAVRAGRTESNPEDSVFIKTDGKIYKILYEELMYAEAQGNYTRIVTKNNVLMPKMPFSSFEELVPATQFLRTHRSFIINRSKIDHIEGNRVFVHNAEVPIGSNYRDTLFRELGLSK